MAPSLMSWKPISIENFSALERLVQNLQVAILVAASESSEPITVDAIRRHLRQTVEKLSASYAPIRTGPRTIRVPERPATEFLERRLDNLRGFVLQMAENVSRDANLPEVTPAVIESCWRNVFEKPTLVASILDLDSVPVEPVEESHSGPELLTATAAQNS